MNEKDIWIFYSLLEKGISVCSDDLSNMPLSAFDIQRIRRMRKTEDRNRSIAGRLLLQKAITSLNISEDAICTIEWDQLKKPFIHAIYPLQFNISHSGQCVVCALTTGKVGVDIEKMDCHVDINDFADVFSNKELDSIDAFSSPYRQFYKLWTLKESVLKAKGTGFLTFPIEVQTLENPVQIDGERFFTHHDFINDYSLSVATLFPVENIHLKRINLSEQQKSL